MATNYPWSKSKEAFNSNPLSLDDIRNILKDYRREGEKGESYLLSESVRSQLVKKYPTLPYALFHHKFFEHHDSRNVGEEYRIDYMRTLDYREPYNRHKRVTEEMEEFDSNPLSINDVRNILKDYRSVNERIETYHINEEDGAKLAENYRTLRYALWHYDYIVNYDSYRVGEEYWIVRFPQKITDLNF